MLERPLFIFTDPDKHSRSAESWGLFGVKEREEKQGWAVTQTGTHARAPMPRTQGPYT